MTTRETKVEIEAIYDKAAELRAELVKLGATQEEIAETDELLDKCREKLNCCELILAAMNEERTMTKAEFMAERYNAGSYDGIQADEGCCPCCKSKSIELIENDWQDGELGCYYECNECGIGYYIWYKLQYVEHCGFTDTEE